MKNTLNFLLVTGLLFLATTVSAQVRIGHINSAELLSLMPAAKSAESTLESYTKQKQSQLEGKMKNLETEYKAIEAKLNTLTPQQIKAEEQRFGQMQQEISQFEQQAQQEIAAKRENLLSPILQKADTAIKQVASENGYTYILDTSMGTVLHADSNEDIMSKVRSKLGF